MGKKLLIIMTIICMMCSSVFMLSGCSGKKSTDKNIDPQNVLESVRPPKGFVLYGSWIDEKSDDISMEITEIGDDEYDVTILQRSGESKSAQWEFSGKFDREGGFLSYEDCIKTEHVFDEDGNILGGGTIERSVRNNQAAGAASNEEVLHG